MATTIGKYLQAVGLNYLFDLFRNAGGFYKDLEVVVTSAIGCQIGPDDHGMRVVKVDQEKVSHHYHPLNNFPMRITLNQ